MRKTWHLLILPLALLGAPSPAPAQEAFSLDQLLEIGRERNPTLLSLRAAEAAMEAHRRDAGRLPNPEVEFETGEGDLFDSDGSWSIREYSVRQSIENPFTRSYRLGALQRRAEAAGESVRLGSLEVDYEVRLHVSRILFLQERVGLARLNAEALGEIRSLMETRAAAGEVRELEAIRLRVEHLRAMNEVQAAEMELDQFRRHLNTFLGEALPENFVLEGELEADLEVLDLGYLREEILPAHPALGRAALEREAAAKDLQGSRVGWLPNPVVSASTGRELEGDVTKFGFGFQIPLWNQSRAATRQSREFLSQMTHREEALRLELQAQLMIHHNHLLMHRRTLELFQEGLLEEAEASMEIAETSYRAGEISFVEYLDARRTYQSILIEYQQALYDWNRELAELDRAAGGGTL
jgi:cobalt-zinc-cadmium efflux system outer membrane protein